MAKVCVINSISVVLHQSVFDVLSQHNKVTLGHFHWIACCAVCTTLSVNTKFRFQRSYNVIVEATFHFPLSREHILKCQLPFNVEWVPFPCWVGCWMERCFMSQEGWNGWFSLDYVKNYNCFLWLDSSHNTGRNPHMISSYCKAYLKCWFSVLAVMRYLVTLFSNALL